MAPAILKYKPDFSQAQRYWDAFWKHECIDRPCTVIWAKKSSNRAEPAIIQPVMGNFADTFARHQLYLDSHAFLGECMPGFRCGFGPDQMAGFFGAPITMGPASSNTSWSEKIVDDWKKFLPLQIAENSTCFNRMKEYHRAASEYFKGKCLLYNIDLHSNIDTLEGLRGAERLLYDIIDSPDVVKRAMMDVRKLYTYIYETFYDLSGAAEYGTADRCLALYSRGKYNIVSADFIALLSPEMMREFVLPALEEEAAYLDHSCFHLDGPDALRHLDTICGIKDIDVIQWQPGSYNKPAFEWPEVIDRIQQAGKAAVIPGTPAQIKAIHGRYKPHLVVYDITADTESQGLELLDWLKTNT